MVNKVINFEEFKAKKKKSEAPIKKEPNLLELLERQLFDDGDP